MSLLSIHTTEGEESFHDDYHSTIVILANAGIQEKVNTT
jgi:hypothetical protein